MKNHIIAILLLTLMGTSGCVMYPRYYSTGRLLGTVVDNESRLPVSDALVLAEVRIRDYDAMNGEKSKRVDSAYSITDSEGRFEIPSMSTFYMYFTAIMRERKASGYVIGVHQPNYRVMGRTNDTHGLSTWIMSREKNTKGLDQIKKEFTGWHSITIRRSDEMAFRTIIQELYQNDEHPNKDEQSLYKRLMK
jgi:hypothetical protein